jgi:hypothetical protein
MEENEYGHPRRWWNTTIGHVIFGDTKERNNRASRDYYSPTTTLGFLVVKHGIRFFANMMMMAGNDPSWPAERQKKDDDLFVDIIRAARQKKS